MLQINQDAASELLTNPEAFGLTLSIILEATIDPIVLYGLDDGEPLDSLTIFHELERRYRVKIPEAVENKIQAVMTLMVTEAFENDPTAFTAVALAFTEGYLGDLVTGILEELDSQAILWTLFEAAAIDPHLRPLSDPVRKMIVEVMSEPQDDTGGILMGEEGDVAEVEPEDPVQEFMETMQELKAQLDALQVSKQIVDQLLNRGLAAMPDANSQTDQG